MTPFTERNQVSRLGAEIDERVAPSLNGDRGRLVLSVIDATYLKVEPGRILSVPVIIAVAG